MSSSETIRCEASRLGRTWVVRAPGNSAYGHGRTLKIARADIEEALALAGVTGQVELIPTSPELEELRRARDTYSAALAAAVDALGLRRTTLRDIALATEVPTPRVKAILAAGRNAPAIEPTPSAPATPEPVAAPGEWDHTERTAP